MFVFFLFLFLFFCATIIISFIPLKVCSIREQCFELEMCTSSDCAIFLCLLISVFMMISRVLSRTVMHPMPLG